MKAAGEQVRFPTQCLPLLELEDGRARAAYCELLFDEVNKARARGDETCTLIKPDFTTEEGVMDPEDVRVRLQENPSCDQLMVDLPRRYGPLSFYQTSMGNSILLRQPAPLSSVALAKEEPPPACTGENCVQRSFAQLGFSPDINVSGRQTLLVLTNVDGERLGAQLTIRYRVTETPTEYIIHCDDIRDGQGRRVVAEKKPLTIKIKKQPAHWRERAAFEVHFRTNAGDREQKGLIASVRLVTL
ncbi:MAG: hypothetical protein HY465_03200 [Deltaproteobacteria bacterium]|nr:hypothetical protein [Deltaproteobacteria bacterium]